MGKIVGIHHNQLSEETASRLAAIVDSSFDAIISKDINGIIESWNAAAERLFGYLPSEAIGQPVLMLIPENRYEEEVDIISRIRRGERVETFETMRLRKDGVLIPVSLTVSPIKNSRGEIIGASKIARDISALKESERKIRLLLREVNHRVKNQFAVLLSMIRETRKRTDDPEEFEFLIRERIIALSKSHDLLVSSEWVGASVFDLVEEHLKPFGHEEQVTLSGPMLTLLPNSVQYLGMAFHELATNSTKYGALSGNAGRITVSWQVVVGASGEREFSLAWEETSVPKPGRGNSRGFGTVVLQRVAPQSVGGTAIYERQAGFVRWVLTAPASSALVSPDFDSDRS